MSDPVVLMTAPNVPMAEVLCGKLKEAGIGSYYQDAMGFTGLWGGSAVNPALPVAIYVYPDDIDRARRVVADHSRD